MKPSERVAEALDRIEAADPDVRAWVVVDRENALRAAKERDRDPGPLQGMPFGVKDMIDVAGLPTECGSPVRRGHVARSDAWLVARLREAGAIPIGKTVTTEFAYFSPGPTRNPRDLSRTPGGSSSGSAAAVAAGMVPLALGTQTAGSVTRPASFCGIAGYVAAHGTLPLRGIVGMCPALDSAGLLAASVSDLARVHEVLTGEATAPDPRPPRLLVWDGTEAGGVGEEMLAALHRAEKAAVEAGAVVEPCPVPMAEVVDAHGTVMAYEAARSHVGCLRQEQISTRLSGLIAAGRAVPSGGYRAALRTAAEARARLAAAEYDAILAPAALGAALPGLGNTGSPVLSRPWQLLGYPAVTVPGLSDAAGMPLGMQLAGRPGRMAALLAVAGFLETAISPG
ncbi:amidase [Amycolatopsis jejuensis]|uniref:amidase n=1 Tax=Amycolatopsis jejuensis TaxID=330084 RepID=UPI000525D22B|nr:amidase [Amycolatopsis jejuensis]